MSMAEWGAFAFGGVLGWFLYYLNRYRKSEVGLGDLVTLLGAIGGGSVTALFGDAKTALFGAYGLGLAVGFFAYFLMLLVLVRLSDGAFGVTWFLDGRRRKLADDEVIPEDVRPTVAAMLPGPPHPATVAEQQNRAVAATADALRELMRKIGDTKDDDERERLGKAEEELTQRYDELLAVRLREVVDSEPARQAIAKLSAVTGELADSAREMKSASDAVATAAKVIDRLARVIALLSVFA